MKKLIVLILALTLCLAFTACGKNEGGTTTTTDTATETAVTPAATTSAEGEVADETTTEHETVPKTTETSIGTLAAVSDKTDYAIRGMLITSGSGQHDYGMAQQLAAKGYKTQGLSSEFYLNEWIEFYIDTDSKAVPVSVYAVMHTDDADYSAMTQADLENIAAASVTELTPDAENYGYLGSLYINPESNEPGTYDFLFVVGGAVRYVAELNISAEPT